MRGRDEGAAGEQKLCRAGDCADIPSCRTRGNALPREAAAVSDMCSLHSFSTSLDLEASPFPGTFSVLVNH